VERSAVPALTLAAVQAAARAFVGEIMQRAPEVSAIKQGGVALHKRVRRGEAVQAPERRVHVHDLEIRALHDGSEIELAVHSGKGFYVRALARDLARALGTCGHLTALRRTQSGQFTLEHAVAFEQVQSAASGDAASREALARAVLPIRTALAHAPALVLDAAGLAHAAHGRAIAFTHVLSGAVPSTDTEPLLLCDSSGTPVALARSHDQQLHVVRGLRVEKA
jgi:tRNA pseudouridine55 synthase